MTRDDHAIIMPGEEYPDDREEDRIRALRLAAIIVVACVLAILFGAWLLIESRHGYVFHTADCRTIELSRAQTEGARERLEAIEVQEQLNLWQYRLELLEERVRSLWDAATKDRLT